jgi:hypothetical protein
MTGPAGWRLAHLPVLLAVAGGLLVAAAAGGWLLRGPVAAAGAAVGVGMVVAGYLFSTLVIAWADAVRPRLVLPLGLASYVLKLGVVAGGLFTAAARDWPGLLPMAAGVVAAAAVWPAAQLWWVVRHSRPPAGPPGGGPGNVGRNPGPEPDPGPEERYRMG